MPSEGVVQVPRRGSTSLGCTIVGEVGVEPTIVWTRDSHKFRDGSYSYQGEQIMLDRVTLQDAGLYYCTAQGPDGATKTASIQVQVCLYTVECEQGKCMYLGSFPTHNILNGEELLAKWKGVRSRNHLCGYRGAKTQSNLVQRGGSY